MLSWSSTRSIDSIAPRTNSVHNFDSSRYVIPTLTGDQELLNPLMLWWVLLFGLSIIARYQPSIWIETLEVDRSTLAVPLEGVLEKALSAIPALVHHELLGV